MIDQSFSDTLEHTDSAFSVILVDTVKILDTAYFLTSPIFWLSIASIATAISALVIPLILKMRSNRKQKATFEKFVLYQLTVLLKSFEFRIPLFANFATKFHDIQSGSIVYDRILMHPAKTLSDIDQNDLYNVLINYKKPKVEKDFFHFKSILDAIEFFILHEEASRINTEKFIEDLRKYQSDFKKNLDNILRSLDRDKSANIRNNVSTSSDEFLKMEDEIISDWLLVEHPYHFFVTRDQLLIPLKKHAIANVVDERAILLLERIIKCNYALAEIVNIRKNYGKVFESIVDAMKKKKETLNSAINHFKNRNV